MQNRKVLAVRRDTGTKASMPWENLRGHISAELDKIQREMFERVQKDTNERLKRVRGARFRGRASVSLTTRARVARPTTGRTL
jgi:hypothetical protein